MKKVLLYIWQLPQNIVGWLLKLTCKSNWQTNDFTIYYRYKFFKSAVSLGNYIIADMQYGHNYRMAKHEHGHQIQSLYLGPLYLIVIGLPSVIGNLLHRKVNFDYYKQPWEAWADKLGGVER